MIYSNSYNFRIFVELGTFFGKCHTLPDFDVFPRKEKVRRCFLWKSLPKFESWTFSWNEFWNQPFNKPSLTARQYFTSKSAGKFLTISHKSTLKDFWRIKLKIQELPAMVLLKFSRKKSQFLAKSSCQRYSWRIGHWIDHLTVTIQSHIQW